MPLQYALGFVRAKNLALLWSFFLKIHENSNLDVERRFSFGDWHRRRCRSARFLHLIPAVGEPQVIHIGRRDEAGRCSGRTTSSGITIMAPGYENLRTANWIYTAPDTTVVWIEAAEHKCDK